MSAFNGVYEVDGGEEWRRRYTERLTIWTGPLACAEEMAQAAWRESADSSPENAADDEAVEWAATGETPAGRAALPPQHETEQ